MKTESIIQRLQEIEELRKQGNRFDLQNIEEDWTDLVDAQIDLERNTTTEIKELQVRETKMKSQSEGKKDYLLNIK